MRKDVASISLRILLVLLMISLPINISENYPNSSHAVGKEIIVSHGNTTINYVYLNLSDEMLDLFHLFNVTVSEAGWYHLEIWIDIFNPSDEPWGIIEYVSENKTIWLPRMLIPHLIHWPIDMIEFLITEETVNIGTFNWIWGPYNSYLSAHEYRRCAMWIIADFEAVKPGIIEISLWDQSRFFLELLISNDFKIVEANVTEVRVLEEGEVPEFLKFPEPPQPPNEFGIVVYSNEIGS